MEGDKKGGKYVEKGRRGNQSKGDEARGIGKWKTKINEARGIVKGKIKSGK